MNSLTIQKPKKLIQNVFKQAATKSLSASDVRTIFEAVLNADPQHLEDVLEAFPTVLTYVTIERLKQDMRGYLTGREEESGRLERKIDYDTIRYMIERCYGKDPLTIEVKAPEQNSLFDKILALPLSEVSGVIDAGPNDTVK